MGWRDDVEMVGLWSEKKTPVRLDSTWMEPGGKMEKSTMRWAWIGGHGAAQLGGGACCSFPPHK
jgi:hypothetical protein